MTGSRTDVCTSVTSRPSNLMELLPVSDFFFGYKAVLSTSLALQGFAPLDSLVVEEPSV